jgi:aquaporin Z
MNVAIDQEDWKKVLAEVVGVFFFFFVGIGTALLTSGAGPISLLYVALGHGVTLAIAITALGAISGGHFNPAVTIGFLLVRKISPLLALLYILGQLVGGVLAGLALIAIIPESVWRPANLALPALGTGISVTQGLLMEVILTFFLVLAIFGTVVDPRPTRIGGFGIGLTVFVGILVGGPISGGAMNPARAFAPAILSGNWTDQWIYWVGPIVGGAIAALLYVTIFLPKGDEPVVVAPAFSNELVEPPLSEPGLLKDR